MPAAAASRSAQHFCCGVGLLLLLIPAAAPAVVLEGRVVHVADGDTLTVLDDQYQQHKVRLAGIDAPERSQAYGRRAHDELIILAKSRRVTVDWSKLDRYHRIIGVVRVAPPGCAICKPSLDVGLTLVQYGYAWHYRAYEREQATNERMLYREAETTARTRHAGLWAGDAPVPPWDWRRARKGDTAIRH